MDYRKKFVSLESSKDCQWEKKKVNLTVHWWIFKSLYLRERETKFSCKNSFRWNSFYRGPGKQKYLILDLRSRILIFLNWSQKVFFGRFYFSFHVQTFYWNLGKRGSWIQPNILPHQLLQLENTLESHLSPLQSMWFSYADLATIGCCWFCPHGRKSPEDPWKVQLATRIFLSGCLEITIGCLIILSRFCDLLRKV